MKNTAKLTFCAMMSALAILFMLASYFPYLTYSIPAIAGIFVMISVIEVNKKWALFSYLASSLVIFFLAEPESRLLYIVFFGYYPIIKSIFESVKSRVVEYLLKFLLFNLVIVLTYTVLAQLLGVSFGEMNEFGKYTAVILLFAANIVFPIYDIALSRVAVAYTIRVHPSVIRILKF